MKIDESVVEKKSSFKKVGLTFSSKLDWGSYIISIAKTASKNWNIDLFYDVSFSIHKSNIRPCIEYCCHV